MKPYRMKQKARILFVIAVVVLVFSIGRTIYTGLQSVPLIGRNGWMMASNLLLAAICLVIMAQVAAMLRDVASSGLPFTQRNVHRLQWISWSLILFEPVQLATQFAANYFFQQTDVLSNGMMTRTVTYFTLGGVVLLVGLATLGITMIFAYGFSLQQQADETL